MSEKTSCTAEVKRDTVAFLMPCGGPVEPKAIQSALSVVANSCVNGIPVVQLGISDRTLVHSARNWLAKGFLATSCEWSFWMDSDMVLEPRTITLMLHRAKELNAKILTGIYYQRQKPHKPVLCKKTVRLTDTKKEIVIDDEYCHHPVFPAKGTVTPFKVDATGFGCMLIHREVFEKMAYPYFKFLFYQNGDKQVEASEDFIFCVNARKMGYEIWALPELNCGHIAQGAVIEQKDCVFDAKDVAEIEVEMYNKP